MNYFLFSLFQQNVARGPGVPVSKLIKKHRRLKFLRVLQHSWRDDGFHLDVRCVCEVGDRERNLWISGSGFRITQRTYIGIKSAIVRRSVPGKSQFLHQTVVKRCENQQQPIPRHPQGRIRCEDFLWNQKVCFERCCHRRLCADVFLTRLRRSTHNSFLKHALK